MRAENNGLTISNARTGACLRGGQSAATLLLPLRMAIAPALLVARGPETARARLADFYQLCIKQGIIVPINDDGTTIEEHGAARFWEFHDLVFHQASRHSRERVAIGATGYWTRRAPSPAPLVGVGGEAIALPRQGLPLAVPLDTVLSCRRTRYHTGGIELVQLGTLLFHSCRNIAAGEGGDHATFRRPYPSGGAIHSVTTYVVAWRCSRLPFGVYRYDASGHSLIKASEDEAGARELLEAAVRATGRQLDGFPPVLLCLVAHHARTAWRYRGIAYRLIVAEVGAIFQTLYLVATALGLSPCAIGTGSNERLPQMLGQDALEHACVGEFALGGPR